MIPVFTTTKASQLVYNVCLCFIVLSVAVCAFVLFCGDQIFVDFVSFLSMIIYEVLYIGMMFKI